MNVCDYCGKRDTVLSPAVAFSGDNILYLRDWDEEEGEGDLYLYKNGKSTLVDSGVQGIPTGYTAKKKYLEDGSKIGY